LNIKEITTQLERRLPQTVCPLIFGSGRLNTVFRLSASSCYLQHPFLYFLTFFPVSLFRLVSSSCMAHPQLSLLSTSYVWRAAFLSRDTACSLHIPVEARDSTNTNTSWLSRTLPWVLRWVAYSFFVLVYGVFSVFCHCIQSTNIRTRLFSYHVANSLQGKSKARLSLCPLCPLCPLYPLVPKEDVVVCPFPIVPVVPVVSIGPIVTNTEKARPEREETQNRDGTKTNKKENSACKSRCDDRPSLRFLLLCTPYSYTLYHSTSHDSSFIRRPRHAKSGCVFCYSRAFSSLFS